VRRTPRSGQSEECPQVLFNEVSATSSVTYSPLFLFEDSSMLMGRLGLSILWKEPTYSLLKKHVGLLNPRELFSSRTLQVIRYFENIFVCFAAMLKSLIQGRSYILIP
jgi:hypothetical protein